MPCAWSRFALCDRPARAQITPELLAEQRLRFGLVIDHKNQNAHI
jgi:hypothetical protein